MRSLYKRVEVEEPVVFSLEYFIFCEEENSYGLEIVKKINGQCLEAKAAKSLSDSREEIEELAERLSCGQVTPVTLGYIVEDMLYERFYRRVAASIAG